MESSHEADSFATLSVLRLSSPSHLLPTSCSPDKDLLLVISRLGVKDTISLWKMQGGKRWEVDVSVGNAAHEEVTGVAWSPDGMSILISHHPPRMSIHSIQDGRQERSVSFPTGSDFRITGVWWHKHQNPPTNVPEMPDFFKRNKTIPGSALSQLKMQPLLDSLKDDTQSITTSDLFSFQGTSLTSSAKAPKLPESIADWPALPPDPIAASIKPFPRVGDPQRRSAAESEVLDDVRPEHSLNYDSLVIAADDSGRAHFFMDATFPLGHVAIADSGAAEVVTLLQPSPSAPRAAALLAHVRDTWGRTNLVPLAANLGATRTPQAREVAAASSAARELAWYMLRVVAEMRAAWIGSAEHGEGARVLGPRWVRELEEKQRAHTGLYETGNEQFPILDLMLLLTTGRASDALSDLLAGLSERGLSKWETTLTDALMKLRDYSEQRLALAAQRLHIILQEAKGWAKSPQRYAVHGFDEAVIDRCLALVNRAIELSAWLAATARDQLWSFKEFRLWLYYESSKVHTEDLKMRPLSWDVLEVDRYLADGLAGCSLDKWFDGEGENKVPEIAPSDVRAAPPKKTLEEAMAEARRVLDNPALLASEYEKRKREDIEHLDRNLEALVREIAATCRRVFNDCGARVGGEVVVHRTWVPDDLGIGEDAERLRTRERTAIEDGTATQFVLAHIPRRGESVGRFTLLRLRFKVEMPVKEVLSTDVAAMECRLEDGSEVEVVDFEFFDEETIVVVLKRGGEEGMYLATVGYQDLEYRAWAGGPWREGAVGRAEWASSGQLRVTGRRRLRVRGPGAGLGVNGRAGRRTVCVVDGRGTEVEVVDMAGEEDEEVA